MIRTGLALAAFALCSAASAAPGDIPIPKMFKDAGFQKGQWRAEILEMNTGRGTPASMPRSMTLCMDSMMDMARERGKARPDCATKIIRDTSSEAVVETTCTDSAFRSTMTRENARTFLVQGERVGKGEPFSMKARYTYEGECKAGAPVISFDKGSDQCRKIRAESAKMDPATACARAGANRAQCEEQMRRSQAQMQAMCQ